MSTILALQLLCGVNPAVDATTLKDLMPLLYIYYIKIMYVCVKRNEYGRKTSHIRYDSNSI